jgi:DNA-binding NtrC family response regulator
LPERSTDTTLPSRERSSASDTGVTHAWSVTVLYSPVRELVSRRIDLGGRLGIGRREADGVELAIDDAKLSREHASITRVGVIVEIRDRNSRNGTFVNGARVAESMLQPGDIVRIGDTVLELGDAPSGAAGGETSLLGTAPAFAAAVGLAERVAPSDLPLILLGETGTGKEVLAQHIHRRSGRSGPLIAINCASLVGELVGSTLFGHCKGAFTGATTDRAGLFVEAQGGTLFLDEIGELDIVHQAKLLRALEAREVIPVGGSRPVHTDARVIAATNRELATLVTDGGFRPDLYARLAGAIIRMPPLRARRGDILRLAEHFLAQPPAIERRWSGQAVERLLLHPWPRNIRELRLAMRRLAIELGDRVDIRPVDVDAVLEAPIAAASDGPRRGGVAEQRPGMPTREELTAQLVERRGNISQLAAHYGKDSKQIYRWLKHYRLDLRSYR